MSFVISILIISVLITLGLLMWAAYRTNPFSKRTIIKQPYRVKSLTKAQAANQLSRMTVRQTLPWRWFAVIKCGLHILHTRYVSSPRALGRTVPEIIKDIRHLRFRPDKLLLISGDHFSGLFVRNLGVFYYPTLDRRIKDDIGGWRDRQMVYLQTVAYALGVFAKHPVPTTTIVETGAYAASCINFYAYPSDTVYGILYALAALVGKETAAPINYAPARHSLETATLADALLEDYKPTIEQLYGHYRQTAYDTKTGLVKINLHMSGAKDITRRSSAFYDNVIFWKTTQLAMELAIIESDKKFLADLKARILTTFWLEQEGFFLEDLSPESREHSYYSSDWLIVLATGFLSPAKASERGYFERSVEYIHRHGIAEPLPVKYQADTRAHRQFFAVRVAVASYGGDAIWSFWGMEYIKVLMLLHKFTERPEYKLEAAKHIANYEKAMLRDGGFAEVYDPSGELLQTPLYRAIRQTGWVIGFEQVKAMQVAMLRPRKAARKPKITT